MLNSVDDVLKSRGLRLLFSTKKDSIEVACVSKALKPRGAINTASTREEFTNKRKVLIFALAFKNDQHRSMIKCAVFPLPLFEIKVLQTFEQPPPQKKKKRRGVNFKNA